MKFSKKIVSKIAQSIIMSFCLMFSVMSAKTVQTNATTDYTNYYLCGYINGSDNGVGGDSNGFHDEFRFNEQGKLIVTFTSSSYVYVKTTGNEHIYKLEAYQSSGSPVVIAEGNFEPMLAPSDIELEFTLVDNNDDTFTLSYAPAEKTVSDILGTVQGGFPTSSDGDAPSNAWINSNNEKMFSCENDLYIGGESDGDFFLSGNTKLTKDGNNYKSIGDDATLTFVMTNNALVSVQVEGLVDCAKLNGSYAPVVPVTIASILPNDFPIYYVSFPENSWVNENGILLANFSNICLYLSCSYSYNEGINTVLTKEGDNYSFTCGDGTKTTFVMETEKLVKIIVANNPNSEANGEYKKPLSDSDTSLNIEFGEKSVDYSVSGGVGIINMSKDNYEMVAELYFDFSATNIPAGVYSLSDTGDDSTALISEGIVNGAPKKSYIALTNNKGEITDCWLMNEGTITVSYDGSKMIVEVNAQNTNGKSIQASGTYFYTISDILEANSNFPKSSTESFSSDAWLNEKGIKMCYFPTQKLFRFGLMSYYMSDTYGLTRTSANQYKFEDQGKFIEFNLTDGVLSSVVVSNYSKTLDGTYSAHTTHTVSETFSKIEPTCTEAGSKAYYKCICGKYFSDEGLTKEIVDISTWLIEDGDGYIAPLGHDFSKNITYLWNEDNTECIAKAECSRCDASITNEATVTVENGYAVATFEDKIFETQRIKLPEPTPEEKEGLSTGAIIGIVVGSILGVCLIAYIAMFFVWKKNDKALKFLKPSYIWINSKIFKK